MSKFTLIRAFACVDGSGAHWITFSPQEPVWCEGMGTQGQWSTQDSNSIGIGDPKEIKKLWPKEPIPRGQFRELVFEIEGPMKIKEKP